MTVSRILGARRAVMAALGGVLACGDVPLANELAPAGVIEGTVVYSGPLPCTQRGHVLGAALLLVFDQNLLPPPAGLGTTARSLATVPGDVLFSSVTGQLPASDDDTVRCPTDTTTVTVSAPWTVGPLPAGRYQVRGFYDRDGDFSPTLRTHNLPTAGDVAGGALANAAAALGGAAPVYQPIELGVADAQGALRIPSNGALVSGVTVNLGLVLPMPRPIAHVSAVLDERPSVAEADRQTNKDDVRVPVDFRFGQSPTVDPINADREFIRLVLSAGVPAAEVSTGLAPPLSLQVGPPYDRLYLSVHRTASGEIETTPEASSPPVADLFPQAVLGKLDLARDPLGLTPQASPAVILSGLVVDQRLLSTTAPTWATKGVTPSESVNVLLRPSVICAQPTDPTAPLVLVTPSFRSRPTTTDPGGQAVVSDFVRLRTKLAERFGRSAEQVKVVEGCLPPGALGINLVYDTGQAWSLPNEAGVCQSPQEVDEGNGQCKQQGQPARPRLASQAARIRLVGLSEAGFCDTIAQRASDAAPANGADRLAPEDYLAGVPRACLTAAEQADEAALRAAMSNP